MNSVALPRALSKPSLYLIAMFLLALTSYAVADVPATTKPERAGMSSERLSRLSAMGRSYVEQDRLPGVLTLVARDGKVVHQEAVGALGREDERPLTPESLFRIYSMTKPVTAVALMTLYEEGAFALEDPVSRYVPAFADVGVWTPEGIVPAKQPMTMHHLLTHTAGLSYGFDPEDPVDQLYRQAGERDAADMDEFVERVTSLPLVDEPGTRWHYSVASDVLGAVAEAITGVSFDVFLHERIFEPLGMTDTWFSVPDSEASRLGPNHHWSEEHNAYVTLPVGVGGNPSYSDVTLFLGGQGLVSTVTDYLKFAEMLRNDGEYNGARILSPTTLRYMTRSHLAATTAPSVTGESPLAQTTSSSQGGVSFGLGFGVITDPAAFGVAVSEGTFFWGGAAGTIFWVDPVEEIVGIGMMQLMNSPWPFRKQMMALTYQAVTETKAP